ncbi:MAG: hypothetical protein AAGH40_09210, partial [Verrucomicrobiota bacterium]
FWAVLLGKCLAMEYLVRLYNAPVNTLFYIWFLSIGLAGIATGVYFKLHLTGIRMRISRSTIGLIICAILSLMLLAFSQDENWILLRGVTPLTAATIGGIYLSLDWKNDIPLKRISFAGWTLGAIYMLFINTLNSLLLLSVLFICFSALPAFFIHFKKRKEIEDALRALNQN